MQAERLPLPAAYMDPAFHACCSGVLDNRDLLTELDRLYGTRLLSGKKPSDADMQKLAEFVHDGIYMRLPDESIHAIRAAILGKA